MCGPLSSRNVRGVGHTRAPRKTNSAKDAKRSSKSTTPIDGRVSTIPTMYTNQIIIANYSHVCLQLSPGVRIHVALEAQDASPRERRKTDANKTLHNVPLTDAADAQRLKRLELGIAEEAADVPPRDAVEVLRIVNEAQADVRDPRRGELLEHVEEAREGVEGDAAVGILFADERVATDREALQIRVVRERHWGTSDRGSGGGRDSYLPSSC